ERTCDTGAQAGGEESRGEDLVPTQVDERRVLEEAPRRFEFLREARLALDLCIEVVVDEDEAGVDQRLVEGEIAQLVGIPEIGEEPIDGGRIAEQVTKRIAFFERGREWIAGRHPEGHPQGK